LRNKLAILFIVITLSIALPTLILTVLAKLPITQPSPSPKVIIHQHGYAMVYSNGSTSFVPTKQEIVTPTALPHELKGPKASKVISGLNATAILSSNKVKNNDELRIRIILKGEKVQNISVIEFAVVNSEGKTVYGGGITLLHPPSSMQMKVNVQTIDFDLTWRASKDPYFNVDVGPGIYTVIIKFDVGGETIELNMPVEVVLQ